MDRKRGFEEEEHTDPSRIENIDPAPRGVDEQAGDEDVEREDHLVEETEADARVEGDARIDAESAGDDARLGDERI